VGEEIKMALN